MKQQATLVSWSPGADRAVETVYVDGGSARARPRRFNSNQAASGAPPRPVRRNPRRALPLGMVGEEKRIRLAPPPLTSVDRWRLNEAALEAMADRLLDEAERDHDARRREREGRERDELIALQILDRLDALEAAAPMFEPASRSLLRERADLERHLGMVDPEGFETYRDQQRARFSRRRAAAERERLFREYRPSWRR